MKKSDLKTGMICKLRNGEEYVVMLDCENWTIWYSPMQYPNMSILKNINNNGYMILDHYDKNLTLLTNDHDFDIMQIYINPIDSISSEDDFKKKIMFQREESENTEKELENFTVKVSAKINNLDDMENRIKNIKETIKELGKELSNLEVNLVLEDGKESKDKENHLDGLDTLDTTIGCYAITICPKCQSKAKIISMKYDKYVIACVNLDCNYSEIY